MKSTRPNYTTNRLNINSAQIACGLPGIGSWWLVGINDKDREKVALQGISSDLELAKELNKCYSRFEVHDFSKETTDLMI